MFDNFDFTTFLNKILLTFSLTLKTISRLQTAWRVDDHIWETKITITLRGSIYLPVLNVFVLADADPCSLTTISN